MDIMEATGISVVFDPSFVEPVIPVLGDATSNAISNACIALKATIDEPIKHHFLGVKSPREIWRILSSLYDVQGASRSLNAARCLFNIKFSDWGSGAALFGEMESAIAAFDNATSSPGQRGLRDLKPYIAMMIAPPAYATALAAVRAAHPGEISLSDVQASMADCEAQFSQANRDGLKMATPSLNDTALYVRSGKRPRLPEKEWKELLARTKCNCCGILGHFASKCSNSALLPRNPDQKKSSGDDANVAAEDVLTSDEEDLVMYIAKSGPEFAPDHALIVNSSPSQWLIDSGCSSTMTPLRNMFVNYTEYNSSTIVRLGNGHPISAVGEGDIRLRVIVEGRARNLCIEGVKHVPALAHSLISVRSLNNRGHMVLFSTSGICTVTTSAGKTIAQSLPPGSSALYKLHQPSNKLNIVSEGESFDLIHKRLGHPNPATLRSLIKHGLVEGVDRDLKIPKGFNCTLCIKGKMTSKPFSHGHTRATERLGRIHSDLCGPMEVLSAGKCTYFATLTDNMSSMMWVKLLRAKSDFAAWFMEMDAAWFAELGTHVKIFRSD